METIDTGGGDAMQRDKHIHGDEVKGDKLSGDSVQARILDLLVQARDLARENRTRLIEIENKVVMLADNRRKLTRIEAQLAEMVPVLNAVPELQRVVGQHGRTLKQHAVAIVLIALGLFFVALIVAGLVITFGGWR